MKDADQEVLASIEASQPRRVMGVVMLGGLGVLTLYLGASSPPSLGWLAFLIVVGVVSIWMAIRLWQATEHRIELTREMLRCSDGVEIARVADLAHMDRGFFAFKPSNGFLLRSEVAGPRVWYPGLWWRAGRRIGIGGVTPGSQAKAMSEILAALMAGHNPD